MIVETMKDTPTQPPNHAAIAPLCVLVAMCRQSAQINHHINQLCHFSFFIKPQTTPGLEFECDCLKRKTSCDLCRAPCTNFVEGVLGVLERDFVQLRHGKGSKLLENRNGIQFLLTGITLGLLYESMPEKTGVDELVLQVLIVMLTPRVWQRALEQYGVAPPQSAPRWQVQSGAARKQRSYSARSTGFKKGGAMKDVGAHLPPSSDPNVCSECKVVFQTADMMQECDCNTVTIRYKQRLRPEKSAAANGAPGFMEEIEAQSRPRSHSF